MEQTLVMHRLAPPQEACEPPGCEPPACEPPGCEPPACEPPEKAVPQGCAGENEPYAQAYVCVQRLCDVFCPEEALCKGTLFPDLWQPYAGWKKIPAC